MLNTMIGYMHYHLSSFVVIVIYVYSSTKFSPFEALYGFNPISPPDLIAATPAPMSVLQHIHDIQ